VALNSNPSSIGTKQFEGLLTTFDIPSGDVVPDGGNGGSGHEGAPDSQLLYTVCYFIYSTLFFYYRLGSVLLTGVGALKALD
jgi:hypothetical protein